MKGEWSHKAGIVYKDAAIVPHGHTLGIPQGGFSVGVDRSHSVLSSSLMEILNNRHVPRPRNS